MSGGQLLTALKCHYLSECDSKKRDERHWYRIDDRDAFRKALRGCRRIVIEAAMCTGKRAALLRESIPALEFWAGKPPTISVPTPDERLAQGEAFLRTALLDPTDKQAFGRLAEDAEWVDANFDLARNKQATRYEAVGRITPAAI